MIVLWWAASLELSLCGGELPGGLAELDVSSAAELFEQHRVRIHTALLLIGHAQSSYSALSITMLLDARLGSYNIYIQTSILCHTRAQ